MVDLRVNRSGGIEPYAHNGEDRPLLYKVLLKSVVVLLLQSGAKGRILSEILLMRSAILSFAPIVISVSLSAQGVFSNNTQAVLEKVIQDYPNRFYNIKGELIGQALQTARYRSTLALPGSASTTVTVATTAGGTGADWRCIVLQTADFNEARTCFAQIYDQLSNSIITTEQQKTFILNGQYETPTQDRKYTEVLFSFLPGVGDMKRLHVDLTLDAAQQGWVVVLNVSDQETREIASY
jgi:hypothetical protein